MPGLGFGHGAWNFPRRASGGTPPPPAPSFSVNPSITPTSGTNSTTFTATDGTVANGSVTARRWLLNGTAIGSGTTVVPGATGSLVLENTATGPGGSTTATSAPVTVSAATPGLSATTFTTAPDIQWHAGQSAITMRADTTVTGYISGQILTVTAISGGALLEGQVITTGAAAGTTIVKSAQTGGGNGGNGNYVVSISQTVGSAGSPVSFTIPATQVASVSDLFARCNLTSADGEGPRLMTDALGRKFLRFIAPYNFIGSWLNNQAILNLDTHNLAVVAVCRVHSQQSVQALVQIGSKVLGTGVTIPNLCIRSTGLVSAMGSDIDWNAGSPPANLNRLYAGSQMQVIGSAVATDDGVGGTTTTNATRVGVNEISAAIANSNVRSKGIQGIEIGKGSNSNTGVNGAFYAFIDLYEMALWTQGQFGNRAAMPANFDSSMAAAKTNFSIPTITDSLVFVGDSRTVNGVAHQAANGADGSSYNVATIISEPGSATAVPATTRVLNYALTGSGIGYLGSLLNRTASTANNRASALLASMMLGSGHDRIHLHSGINDINTLWPTDNSAAGTTGIADEMYGTDRTASFTATIANNSNSMSVTGVTGQIKNGSQISATGALPGLSVSSGAGPYTLNIFQTPAITSAAATSTLQAYKSVVEALLTRGYKVTWAQEISYAATDSAGTTELRARIANAVADVTADIGAGLAANLKVYNLSQITLSGSKVFGANYAGSNVLNNIYVDGVHETAVGKRLLVSGADTPANGILANV